MNTPDGEAADTLRIYGNLSLVEMAPVLLAIERYYDGPVHLAHGGVMALWGEGSELASLASTGRADIALNTETQALRGAARHPDMRFIFTVGECPYRIVARRSAGIATLADLRGRRVGTQIDSSADYFLDAMLNTVGLGLADVTRVPFMMKTEKPLTLLPEALRDGEIDAVAMWEPQVARAQNLIGDDAVAFYDPDVYTEKFSLCTTQAKLEEPAMRGRIVAFTRALIEASRLLRTDPQPGWDLVARTSGLDRRTIRDSWGYYQFPATLASDTLDFCERIEPWIAALEGRNPNDRAALARLIDDSVVKEARA
ncbi:MAG: ABC transporter substrate-binding protein [Alphaproteobacteria bacterium]